MPLPTSFTAGTAPGARLALIDTNTKVNELEALIDGLLSAGASFGLAPGSILPARALTRSTAPCVVVFAGSSTTSATYLSASQRYVNLTAAILYSRFPISGTQPVVRSLAEAVSAAPSGAGMHIINAGVSGTRSNDYLTSTTRPQLAALDPAAVVHMVGANDFGNGITPAAYKTNLLSQLTSLRSSISGKCVHILVHSHERYDSAAVAAKVAPWGDFLTKLREIEAASTDVVVVDLSATYNLLGVPSTDPYDLIESDNIHPSAKGHVLIADMLRTALALWPVTAPVTSSSVITSDSFNRTNTTTMAGQSTDVAMGGAALAWESSAAGSWRINGNQLSSGSAATEFVAVPITAANYSLKVTVAVKSSHDGTTLYSIDARRSQLATSGQSCIRVRHRLDGSVSLCKVVAGTETQLGSSTATGVVTAGSTIELRMVGTSLKVLVNDVEVLSQTDGDVVTSAYAGFTKSSTITSAPAYDDMVITAL